MVEVENKLQRKSPQVVGVMVILALHCIAGKANRIGLQHISQLDGLLLKVYFLIIIRHTFH